MLDYCVEGGGGVHCVCRLTCVRYICGSHDASDLLHRLQVGRETCGKWETRHIDTKPFSS